MKRTAFITIGILAIFLGLASAASAARQAPPPSEDSVLLTGAPAFWAASAHEQGRL